MPDISMCSDDACPVKYMCYRHQASGTVPALRWQSYAGFRHTGADGCDRYWPVNVPDTMADLRELVGKGGCWYQHQSDGSFKKIRGHNG